jgi:alkanesulfonate monooxygenase SsuD/methylene tetrahydromethanopterin reductase-like flavin-dependent oxidoreductase (luciferase family)
MKFGIFNFHAVPPHTNSYDSVTHGFAHALAAERAGFHEVWLPEHNGRAYGLMGNAVVGAAAVAAATTKIRIATAVSRLPLHNPVHMAEDMAYVDVLSGGRLDWGVGKGYDQLEFSSYGIPFEERDRRWQENFEAVRQIWSSCNTEFNGEFSKSGAAELLPRPLQRPIIPTFLMVSKSESSIRFAAERLMPMAIGSVPGAEEVKRMLDLYARTAAERGFEERAIRETLAQSWQLKMMHVARTTERAIDEYRDGMLWYYGELNNRAAAGFSTRQESYDYYIRHESVMVGSTERVGEAITAYRETSGIQNIISWFDVGGQPHLQVMNAIAQFGDEIIPAFA